MLWKQGAAIQENATAFSCQFMNVENVMSTVLMSSNVVHSPSIRGNFSCTLQKSQELRRLLVDAIRSIQRNCCPFHCRPVLNIHIEQSHWTINVLTSQMDLNILNWAISPCKLQNKTKNKKGNTTYCENVFISTLNLKKEVTWLGV